ncbi:MAG: double-strand break repair protein AddB [Rhizobiales bacterium]|nr:double-strand break repair protein AddB [Hyphomicrobiales bacterium]
MAGPRLFNIPASAPFLRTLVDALISGRLIEDFPGGDDPLALAKATLYLPTRRACRLARDVFLDVLEREAAILPRLAPIGDVDEDELIFAEAAAGKIAEAALELPPTLDGLERQLLLAQLVLKWAASIRPDKGAPLVANTPTMAFALAGDLARLMDDMATREVAWDELDGLVPDDLDKYWQLTLEFLKIARKEWPAVLTRRGAIEPAERRDKLISAEAARLAAATDGPVIAAGSTGSMPTTAKFLSVIAKLPRGAVVLPGLDKDLDQSSWDLIAGASSNGGDADPLSGHPQFALAMLLRRIEVARDAVIDLAPPAAHGREFLLSEALRPAAATDRWRERLAEKSFADRTDRALADMSMIEAINAEHEALAIAVALREIVEKPEKTAALVTPDRALARRVVAALDRWNVPCVDSGGDPLADTAAGIFARLAAETALGGVEPVTLLALVKHPLFRLGAAASAHARTASLLERAILHGPRPKPGTAGLAQALAAFKVERPSLRHTDPRSQLGDMDIDAASEFVSKLSAALEPLETLAAQTISASDLAARHQSVVAALSSDENGKIAAFSEWDGVALGELFDEIGESVAVQDIALARSDYADFFRGIAAGRIARRPGYPGSRVRIYGPLEARLQTADRIVLGGLIEGVWPPEARSDPWLSRPMRHALGLDLPERRVGLSAHDFVQALGAGEVILTRAAKLAGAPTISSRFVQRLAAIAGTRWKAAVARGEVYLGLAHTLDHPADITTIKRPRPTPPRAARPTQLSVTEIEHWLRDPYTIYAKHILKLAPLDPVDTPPGARDRGTLIHEVLAEFTRKFTAGLPADPAAELIKIGRERFALLDDYPEVRAFWWSRFKRIADWFAVWERERRPDITSLLVETSGSLEIPVGERIFRLTARADRIERNANGHAIVDFKTGQTPTAPQVKSGLAPQLTLEGAILRAGQFPGIAKGASIAAYRYVALKGGEPAGEEKDIAWKNSTPDIEADNALRELTRIVTEFEKDDTPYLSRERPMWVRRAYGDYDHLARVKEWSLSGGVGDDAGDGE